MKKDSEEHQKRVAEVKNLMIRHQKLYRDIGKLMRGMKNSRSAEAKRLMEPRIVALKTKWLQEWRRLKQYRIKLHISVESEDLEARTKSDDVKKWLLSAKPGTEEGESSNFDEFKKVDQDSDSEKKMMGIKVVEGGVSCSSDDFSLLNLDHFKKVQDSDLRKKGTRVAQWDQEKMKGFETEVSALLDAMKFMLSQTTDVVLKLKMLGNCSSTKDVKSRETCRISTLLDLIDQEVGKMATQDQMVEPQETGFGSSKVVLLLHKILQLADQQLDVKGPFGGVETSFEELERFVKDSSGDMLKGCENSELEDMKSRIVKLRALKDEGLKNCEKEVKEMGPIVKELKETIMFGSEHESVIQTYFQSMEQKMVDIYFESAKLVRKEWESRFRRRTNLPDVRIGHQANAEERAD